MKLTSQIERLKIDKELIQETVGAEEVEMLECIKKKEDLI
jgi:hypothetical protein